MLPLAHAAHYLWVLYLPPLLIVIVSIAWTKLSERRGAGAQDGSTSASTRLTNVASASTAGGIEEGGSRTDAVRPPADPPSSMPGPAGKR